MNKEIKIMYDDLADDIIKKINTALIEYNLEFIFDNEAHDGFDILTLNEKVK